MKAVTIQEIDMRFWNKKPTEYSGTELFITRCWYAAKVAGGFFLGLFSGAMGGALDEVDKWIAFEEKRAKFEQS